MAITKLKNINLKVHGDVFRPAASPMLFSALIGTGSQLTVVVLFVVLFAILGELYTERGSFKVKNFSGRELRLIIVGSLLSTAIFVYAATAPVNGYFGGSLYARLVLGLHYLQLFLLMIIFLRMGGKVWIKQMLMSAFFLPFVVCGTAFFINFIAIYYHASRAIPFGTMVRLIVS